MQNFCLSVEKKTLELCDQVTHFLVGEGYSWLVVFLLCTTKACDNCEDDEFIGALDGSEALRAGQQGAQTFNGVPYEPTNGNGPGWNTDDGTPFQCSSVRHGSL